MPIYKLVATINGASETRLIEAKTESGALKHAAKSYLKAEAIRTSEQIREMAELVATKAIQVEQIAE